MKIQYGHKLGLMVSVIFLSAVSACDHSFEKPRGVPKEVFVVSDQLHQLLKLTPDDGYFVPGLQVVVETFDKAKYAYPELFKVYMVFLDEPMRRDSQALLCFARQKCRSVLACGEYALCIDAKRLKVCNWERLKLNVLELYSTGIPDYVVMQGVVSVLAALPSFGNMVIVPAIWPNLGLSVGQGAPLEWGYSYLTREHLVVLALGVTGDDQKDSELFVDALVTRQEEIFIEVYPEQAECFIEYSGDVVLDQNPLFALEYFKLCRASSSDKCASAFQTVVDHMLAGNQDCIDEVLRRIFDCSGSAEELFGPLPGEEQKLGDITEKSSSTERIKNPLFTESDSSDDEPDTSDSDASPGAGYSVGSSASSVGIDECDDDLSSFSLGESYENLKKKIEHVTSVCLSLIHAGKVLVPTAGRMLYDYSLRFNKEERWVEQKLYDSFLVQISDTKKQATLVVGADRVIEPAVDWMCVFKKARIMVGFSLFFESR